MDMYSEYYDYDVDERTDFDYAISELINKEIDRQLKDKVQDYEVVKEKQNEHQKEVNELNNQIAKLQSEVRNRQCKMDKLDEQYQEEIQKVKDEFGKNYIEAMMGDWKGCTRAYYIKKRDTYTNCPHCNGYKKEEVVANGQTFKADCRFCNGSGRISDMEMIYDYECIRNLVVLYKSGTPRLAVDTYGGIKEISEYYQKEDTVKEKKENFNKERKEMLANRYNEFKKKNNLL